MSKYQKEFISMDGKVFSADVYRVLRAFRVTCPAVQHAVKKLLMPGQRGTKDKKQDLNEALLSVSQAIAMADARRPEGEQKSRESAVTCDHITLTEILKGWRGVRETCSGGTLTGEKDLEPEQKLETEPEPKINTVTIPGPPACDSDIWSGPYIHPAHKQLQQSDPELEPKRKLITWRLCVRIEPGELDEQTLWFRWYPSGDIPEDWYPVESYTQPIETVQQLPEGQEP